MAPINAPACFYDTIKIMIYSVDDMSVATPGELFSSDAALRLRASTMLTMRRCVWLL